MKGETGVATHVVHQTPHCSSLTFSSARPQEIKPVVKHSIGTITLLAEAILLDKMKTLTALPKTYTYFNQETGCARLVTTI